MFHSTLPEFKNYEALPPKTNVHYYVKDTIWGSWNTGFVQESHENHATVTSAKNWKGHKHKISHEDIRIVPNTHC